MKKISSREKAIRRSCPMKALNTRRFFADDDPARKKKRVRKTDKENIARAITKATRQLSPDEGGEV